MFWHLLLAHFIADYPLQSDWMVANRSNAWVRLLHGAIHFAMMALLTFPASARAWPWLLLVAAIHMGIDLSKGWFSAHSPGWNRWMYLADQAAHYAIIALLSAWLGRQAAEPSLPIPRLAALVALGLLLVTYVWLVSERVLFAGRAGAADLKAHARPRAWARGGMLALILSGWYALFPAAGPVMAMGMAIHSLYPAGRSGTRALLIDVLVTLAAAGLVIAAGK